VRRFLKGDAGLVGDLAQRLSGSPDLYSARGATASINFITAHDGFTLNDQFSYNDKHNDANGEGGQDGANDNNSWNCGWEGETDDPGINALRRRQVKNALAVLLLSQGVPMILSGDEFGQTQHGNNNAYCHDSELSWLDWSLLERNADLFRFTANLVAFRHAHPVLRNRWHLRGQDPAGCGHPDLSWHGLQAWHADWSGASRTLAFMLAGPNARGGLQKDDYVYAAVNTHWEGYRFELPALPRGLSWHVSANTGDPDAVHAPGAEPRLDDQAGIFVGDRSVVILVGR
jgi:glycogen operon protein